MCYLCVGRFQCAGYDDMAYVDLAVCCPRKAVKSNHSLTMPPPPPHPTHPPKKTKLINPPLSPSFPHPITPLSSQSPTHHAQIPTLPETISPFPHHCSTPLISLLPITPSLDHSPISHSSLSLLCCPLSLSPHLSLIHTWPTQFCTHNWPSH